MHWNEESVVTAAYHHSILLRLTWIVSTLTSSFLHVLNIALEWIRSFFNLTTTDRRQFKIRKLVNITSGLVYLATLLACKVLFSFSVLHRVCTNHSPIQDHILIDVALSHIPDRSYTDFFDRWYIHKSYVNPFFQDHKWLQRWICFLANQFRLNSYEALLKELHCLFGVIMEPRSFERK